VQQYRIGEQPVTIAVAEDLSALEADIRQFYNRFALTAGLLLIALIVIQILIIRGGLRPLQRMRKELGQLERGALPRLTEQAPAEIQPMIREINHLLDVMSQRLQRSRNALGDLAHALKKPLTVLTQLTDDEAVKAQTELHRSLTRQTTAMRKTTDHILKRARLAGEGPAGLAFDARAEIQSLIETLKKMHQDKDCVVKTDIPSDLHLRMDREDLLELLGNLLDNAFKWAQREIYLQVRVNEAGLHISIEDDGPGVAPDQLQHLSQRGTRLDEQVEGHGLGLAIVQNIVALYGGEISFAVADERGGLSVQVHINKA
jgi:signal transduction histidine kinase